GAVAALRGIVANPITVARKVLESRRHVLLVGEGALSFSRSVGIPECDPESLITDRQRKRHAELARQPISSGGGTVGAVALDRHGTIAAGTSTGGTARKLPGPVRHTAPLPCRPYTHTPLAA